METLVWLRVPGDIVFAAGGVLLALYALRAAAAAVRAGRPPARAVPAAASAEPIRGGPGALRLPWTSHETHRLHRLQPARADLPGREPERRATIAEIAAAFDISENHLTRWCTSSASRAGSTTVRGKGGGLLLAMPAE